MARQATFTPRRDKTRKTSPWWISIPPKLSDDGKRQKRFFETRTLAEGEIQRLKVRKENHGTSAKLLSPADEQQSAAALKLLRDKGITKQLSEIVGDYIERWEQRKASVTLDHAFNEYLKFLNRNQRSEVHRKSIENIQDRFKALKDKLVADLKASDIEKGLEGAAPSYRNAMLERVRAVLNYGMKGGRKWLKENPAKDCETISRKLGEVGIYSVEDIQKILSTTATLHPELIPAVALMTFAGVRPDHQDGEITKVDWSHIILDDRNKRVELPASVTKRAKQRSIPIRPALASWLQWHKERGGSCVGKVCPPMPGRTKGNKRKGKPYPPANPDEVAPSILRERFREIYTTAKVERIQDGLRHSFASYVVPIDGADRAESELGHGGGREMLNRHYRSDVRAAVAKKFWAMRAPKVEKPQAKTKAEAKTSKILQFKAA
jgi:hypothetical protein